MSYLENSGITRTGMTKVTTEGQVTIPKRLRDHLGLKPGSSVEFDLAADGRVFLKTRAHDHAHCSPTALGSKAGIDALA